MTSSYCRNVLLNVLQKCIAERVHVDLLPFRSTLSARLACLVHVGRLVVDVEIGEDFRDCLDMNVFAL